MSDKTLTELAMLEARIRRAEAAEAYLAANSRWSSVCLALEDLRFVEHDLRLECERLAEIIAEHDQTPIVITEDDGDAT